MKALSIGATLILLESIAHGQLPEPFGIIDRNWTAIHRFSGELVVKKTKGEMSNENFVATYHWMEDIKDRFKVRLIISRFNQNSFIIDESYNGATYTLIDKTGSDSLCKIGKTLPEDIKSFGLQIGPLEPFRFLTRMHCRTSKVHPNPRYILDALNDGSLKEAASHFKKDTVFMNLPASSFEIDGDQGFKYRVFLSENSNQLLGWQCFSPEKRLDTELIIERWGVYRAESFVLRYPADFKISYFKNAEELTYEYSCSFNITDISNSETLDVFEIDPVEADYIYDLDNKILVTNPR